MGLGFLGGLGGSFLKALLNKEGGGSFLQRAGRNVLNDPTMFGSSIGGQLLGRFVNPPSESGIGSALGAAQSGLGGQQFADQFLQRRKRYFDYLRSQGLV